jgi:hypothetical protein
MGGRERAFELDAPRDQRLFGHRLRGIPDRPLLADRARGLRRIARPFLHTVLNATNRDSLVGREEVLSH